MTTMTIAAIHRMQTWQQGAIETKSLWKTDPRFAAAPAKAASSVRPHQGVMSEYLMFTCLNLGMAAVMMLAIASAFNWVAKACMVAM